MTVAVAGGVPAPVPDPGEWHSTSLPGLDSAGADSRTSGMRLRCESVFEPGFAPRRPPLGPWPREDLPRMAYGPLRLPIHRRPVRKAQPRMLRDSFPFGREPTYSLVPSDPRRGLEGKGGSQRIAPDPLHFPGSFPGSILSEPLRSRRRAAGAGAPGAWLPLPGRPGGRGGHPRGTSLSHPWPGDRGVPHPGRGAPGVPRGGTRRKGGDRGTPGAGPRHSASSRLPVPRGS